MSTKILLTGSTGNLGSYLLHTLSFDPSVAHIYCLNRGGATDSKTRQRSSLRQRGLFLPSISPDFAKITHLTGDLTKPDLALDESTLETLRSTSSNPLTILHNAWPVDFNRHFTSFVPQLHSLQHLINLALSCTPHTARFVFISSMSAAGNWGALPGARASVPEALLDDWKVARLGYGQAKLVAERIVAEAARVSGLEGVVIRVGQVAGPVERGVEGAWPRQEWLPSLVRSSAYLDLLPSSLGPLDRVDWVPVDLLSKIVAELVRGGGGGDEDGNNQLHANGRTTPTLKPINTAINGHSPIIEVNSPHTTPNPNGFASPKLDSHSPKPEQSSILTPSSPSTDTTSKPAIDDTPQSKKPKLPFLHRKRYRNGTKSKNTAFSPKKPTGLGTMEYYHITNPHGTPWSTLLPAVISFLQAPPTFPHPSSMASPHKDLRVVPFPEWVDALAKTAAGGGGIPAASGAVPTTNGDGAKDDQIGIPSARNSGINQHRHTPSNLSNPGVTNTRLSSQSARPSNLNSKRTSYRLSGPGGTSTTDLDVNPAVKLLPFFSTLRDKAVHLPQARSVVLETQETARVSRTMRGLRGVGEGGSRGNGGNGGEKETQIQKEGEGGWMGLWMRQWGRERAF